MTSPSTTYIKGSDASGDSYIIPDFMPAARDIMRRFPCTPGTPSARHLAHISETKRGYDSSSMRRNSSHPAGGPKHLLWALHFMKCYLDQAPGCAAVYQRPTENGSGPTSRQLPSSLK